jgi:hypothetical protein
MSALVVAGVVLWRPLAGIALMAAWRLMGRAPGGPLDGIGGGAIDRRWG